jgi:hypothetical protein
MGQITWHRAFRARKRQYTTYQQTGEIGPSYEKAHTTSCLEEKRCGLIETGKIISPTIPNRSTGQSGLRNSPAELEVHFCTLSGRRG